MNDCVPPSELDSHLLVLCMATYGEGDPTDNAQKFIEWIKTTDANLSKLKFAVSPPPSPLPPSSPPSPFRCSVWVTRRTSTTMRLERSVIEDWRNWERRESSNWEWEMMMLISKRTSASEYGRMKGYGRRKGIDRTVSGLMGIVIALCSYTWKTKSGVTYQRERERAWIDLSLFLLHCME